MFRNTLVVVSYRTREEGLRVVLADGVGGDVPPYWRSTLTSVALSSPSLYVKEKTVGLRRLGPLDP